MCTLCEKQVPRKDNAKRHVRLKHLAEHGPKRWTCEVCERNYKTNLSLDDHRRQAHGLYKSYAAAWLDWNSTNVNGPINAVTMTIQIQIRREFRCTDVFRGWGSVEVSHLPAGKEEDGLEEAHCGQASLHCSCQLLLVRQTVQELWQSSTSQHKVWRWLSVTSSSWFSIITVNIDTCTTKCNHLASLSI